MRAALGLIVLLVLPSLSWAEKPQSNCIDCAQADSTGHDCGWFSLIPPRVTRGGFIAVPIASYSQESGVGLGGEILKPFCMPGGERCSRLSDVRLRGRATFEGHLSTRFETNLRWNEDRCFARAMVSYADVPRHFWGVGPKTPDEDEEIYQPQRIRAYLEYLRAVVSRLKLGVRYEIERVDLLDSEEGGLFDTRDYRGESRSQVAGLGAIFDFDLRDRRYSPRRGLYYQAFALFFDEEFGSDHDFNNYSLDLRHYHALAGNHVLAAQFFAYAAKGSPPIWRYAALGGRSHTRGYNLGRYLDRVLIAFQAEYRMPICWRLGAVFFGGMGDVAPRMKEMRLDAMRPTLGAGLRLGTGPEDMIKISLDTAFGEGVPRFYLYLGDSF